MSSTTNGGTSNGDHHRSIVTDDQKIDPDTGLQQTISARRGSYLRNTRKDSGYEYEDPFAGEEHGDIQYRTMKWWQASMIMIAETISLGILSLPSVLARVGIVAGIILILGLGLIATYSGYVLGQFKIRYPHVHTFADAGEILFSPWGKTAAMIAKEFFGAAQVIFLVFTMGSHVLTWTIMLNTVTDHATCTIVWSVIGFVLLWILDLPRTMKNLSWFSIASFISILGAVFVLMIGLGVSPLSDGHVEVTHEVAFATGFNSVSNIVFAYAGHVSFFSFISEFENPREFPKALFLLQACDVSLYLVVAIVVYYYAGADVTSPALGSAGDIIKKVAWGIAIPTIVIAGTIYGHVAAKYVFVRMFRGTKHLSSRSWFSFGTWALITLILWLVAWIIAESIPVFNDLLGLISALFASWFTYGMSGILWLFMNWHELFDNPRKTFLTVVNFGMFSMGLAICGIGLYASGYSIHEDSQGSGGKVWTCANNGQ